MKDLFPWYWYRAYPFMIVLGIAGLAYQVVVPGSDHGITGFVCGLLVGIGIAGFAGGRK